MNIINHQAMKRRISDEFKVEVARYSSIDDSITHFHPEDRLNRFGRDIGHVTSTSDVGREVSYVVRAFVVDPEMVEFVPYGSNKEWLKNLIYPVISFTTLYYHEDAEDFASSIFEADDMVKYHRVIVPPRSFGSMRSALEYVGDDLRRWMSNAVTASSCLSTFRASSR